MNNLESNAPVRLRILISAYACEPNRGSEPAVGWNIAVSASKEADVWVITRSNNKPSIIASEEGREINWVYYDLPLWVLRLKAKFGLTSLYYLLWQTGSRKIIRRIVSAQSIDLVHHATFGTAFIPPLIKIRGVPILWGPVGGLMSAPRRFYQWFSWKGKIREAFRPCKIWLSSRLLIPFVCREGVHALSVSKQTMSRFSSSLQLKTETFSQVGISQNVFDELAHSPESTGVPRGYVVLMVGRLEHWKGFAFGVEAFARFVVNKPDAVLRIVGDGRERRFLERCAARLGVESRVVFLGSLSSQRYREVLQDADICLFPSLHESGAFVVVESLAAGKPVICFDGNEPSTEVTDETGWRVPLSFPSESLYGFITAMDEHYSMSLEKRGLMAQVCRRRASDFLWGSKLKILHGQYQKIVSKHSGID